MATIEMWSKPESDGLRVPATIDLEDWAASLEFMRGLPDSNIPADLTIDDLVTDDLLP